MQRSPTTRSATAYIALGANIDNPIQQLQSAVDRLHQSPHIDIIVCSPIYHSAAYGVTDQNDFYNAVIKIQTTFSAIALLEHLLATEQQQGRVRERHWGPRCIDLDLLSYNQERWATNRLSLPHPGIRLRRFVLLPLQDIAPEYLLGDTAISDLIANCEPQSIEKVADITLQY